MMQQSRVVPLSNIAHALSSAGQRLFRSLAEHANRFGDDSAVFHVLETWLGALADPDAMLDAVNTAQREFTNYASAHSHWLDRLDLLLTAGGDSVPVFAEGLWRVYIFQQASAADALWELYRDLQNAVLVETGVQLSRVWDEWIIPAHTFMGMVADALVVQQPLYRQIFDSADVEDLVEESTPAPLRPPAPPEAPVVEPDTVAVAATLSAYLSHCQEAHEYVDLQGSQAQLGASLPLTDVYVPLRLIPLSAYTNRDHYVRYEAARYDHPAVHSFRVPLGHHELEGHAGLSVREALESGYQILLLGLSGAGKTTLLRHLALEHARILLGGEENGLAAARGQDGEFLTRLPSPVPIFVDLGEFIENRQGEESLLDYILQRAAEDVGSESAAALLRDLLEAGRCLVLLDGLDQAVNDAQRRALVTCVSAFAREWAARRNRVVVSSRFGGYTVAPLPPDFNAFMIRTLDRSQMGPFILKWSLALERHRRPPVNPHQAHHHAQAQALALMREVTSNPQLYTLAHTPLWLRILITIYRKDVLIPTQRIALCNSLADALIREWRLPQTMSHTPAVLENEVTILLGELADYLHGARATGTVGERELRQVLGHAWHELHPDASADEGHRAIDHFLTQVRHHRGVLAEVAPQRYGFIYHAMQEYFAARRMVASYRLAAQRIRLRLHDPRWEDAILLAIAFTARSSRADASELIETAILARGDRAVRLGYIPSPYETVLKRDLLFAARLLGEGVEAEPGVTQPIVDELMHFWVHADRDDPGRFALIMESARRHLVNLDGTPASRRALQAAEESLDDYLEHTRAYAVDALTFWPAHATDAHTILATHAREADLPSLVKRAVAGAFGRVGMLSQPAYVLLVGLATDPDPQVHEASRRTLESAAPVPDDVLRLWVGMLRQGNAPDRRLGLRALQRVGTLPPLVVGELLRLFDDPDPAFKQAVIETLSRIASLPDNALAAICRAIEDAPTEVRVAALAAVARPVRLPDEVLDYLMAWRHDTHVAVRQAVTRALGVCLNDSAEITDALLTLLHDSVPEVRVVAVDQLIRKAQHDSRVMHTLLQHTIEDQAYVVRMQLAASLGHVRKVDDDLRAAIRTLLSDGTLSVQEAMIEAIAQLGNPGDDIVEDILVSMSASTRPSIAARAVRTLASLRQLPDSALRALVLALPAHWETLGESIKACLQAHAPLNVDIGHLIMDLAVLRDVTPTPHVPVALRALATEMLGFAADRVPGVLELLLRIAKEARNPDAQIAAARAFAYMRTPDREVIEALLCLLQIGASPSEKGPVTVRCAVAVALGSLAHNQPEWPLADAEVVQLADALFGLLGEVPRRAAWEPESDLQNDVFLALSHVAARLRPAAPRLPG